MREMLTHRGPDDSGLYVDDKIGLAHRRLSIIGLSSAAHQPMCDESGTVWVVLNGEIYNFSSLRDELSSRGYRFKTRSDTEVILALYVLDGKRFVERLNGIFAFALWDSRIEQLYLARDRMGVKPLYIYHGKDFVAVASEIKALLRHPDIEGELDHDSIPEYLAFRQIAGSRTMFKGIEEVMPGRLMLIVPSHDTLNTYWSLPRCVGQQADENECVALTCPQERVHPLS